MEQEMYLDKLHDDSNISDVTKFEVVNKLSSKDNVNECIYDASMGVWGNVSMC